MLRPLLLLCVGGGAILAGCAKPSGPVANEPSTGPVHAAQSDPGIVPSAAGGMAPVTNPEAVDGAGGGGTGLAAKDMARRAAGAASAPSGSGVPDESGE